MKHPKLYTSNDIKHWDTEKELDTGQWVPTRPYHLNPGLSERLRLAWGVFTGKYDALLW